MRLLPKQQSLGELGDKVDDVELFCRDGLRRGLAMCGGTLEGVFREEALQYLILQLHELWSNYDPALNSSFSKYAYPLLPLRLVDWYRDEFGDTRYSERPKVSSLDDYREELGRLVDHSSSAEEEVLFRVAWAR